MIRLFSFAVLICISVGCSKPKDLPPKKTLNFESLLSRMTNVTTFAEAPLGESFLESSYDRSGGNQDWAVYTRAQSNGRITLLDVEGAGYVSRVWVASFAAKTWHFYFDGEDEPRWSLAQDELFGERFPFSPSLAGRSGGGRYSLLPMPFATGLRIEIEPLNLKASNRNYFQINYTKLDTSLFDVESIPANLSAVQSNLVVDVNRALDGMEEALSQVAKMDLEGVAPKTIGVGASMDFWTDDEEGLLESFSVRLEDPSGGVALSERLLRQLRLKMYWDGATEPSVDVPLGDFFCNPYYFRSFAAMPLGRVDDTFVCRFPMGYSKGARCVISNQSKVPVTMSVGARGDAESFGTLGRKFHAVWAASGKSGSPLTMLKTSGSGHYVGCFLSAIGQDGTWTILEGDEYLKPDPGIRSAQLGTGLEDYFSGAYYYTSLFDLPFHGLIEKGAMRTDQYRFHMLESVAYDQSFLSGIEFGDQNAAKGFMSSVSYWYADSVAPASLYAAKEHLLYGPKDKYELHGLMAQLFLLERDGLYADAGDRMAFFAKRYANQPWAELLNARALGYREKAEGFQALKEDYIAMAKSSFAPAARAAADRLWMEEGESNALLGIHALGKYKLYLDAKLVGEGIGKGELRVYRTPLTSGEHSWEVEFEPTSQGSFFSLCQRTRKGDILSTGDWKVTQSIPQDGQAVPEIFTGLAAFPNMTVWAFDPNAYVGMQSPAMGVTLWKFYGGRPLVKQVRLKKTWSTEDVVDQVIGVEQERSDEEKKANAIN